MQVFGLSLGVFGDLCTTSVKKYTSVKGDYGSKNTD